MNELEQYKERLRIALSAARICIFEVDILRQQYTFFENAETIFGVSGDDILKDVQPYSVLEPEAYRLAVSEYFSHPDDWEVIEDAFAQILNGKPAIYDARMKAGGSGFIWCRIHVTPIIEDNKPVRMIGVIMDITDTKKKTESLEQAVNRDAFTGFYNKEYSITLIRDIMEERKNLQHALVILDIDNFKHFNDTYGHDQGDRIIKSLSRTIKMSFRKTDILGRFGGDEFIIFIPDIEDEKWLYRKLQNLSRLEIDDFVCTNSMGVAVFPREAANFNLLFKKADIALYHAKISKEKPVFFSELDRSEQEIPLR